MKNKNKNKKRERKYNDKIGMTTKKKKFSVNQKGKEMVCSNCSQVGHTYKKCAEPQISYGIICYKYNQNIQQNEIIIIMRKDTIGYMEFMRGKYEIDEEEYLLQLFDMMTSEEKKRILEVYDFDKLRNILGMTRENTTNIYEYNQSYRKFNSLKSDDKLKELLTKYNSEWKLPEWGLPKGRKNAGESPKVCAVREFYEETGLSINDIEFHVNMKPLEETYMGINSVTYKHIYYFAKYVNSDDKLILNPNDRLQAIEVADIKWIVNSEINDYIREYHKEKISIIRKAFQILRNKDKYFSEILNCVSII